MNWHPWLFQARRRALRSPARQASGPAPLDGTPHPVERPLRLRQAALVAAALLCGTGCGPSYQSEVRAEGYVVEVVANDIRMADGLAFHSSGALLVSEEYRGGGVKRVDPVSGLSSYIARDLADPDNLLVVDEEIYLTEEDVDGRIAKIDRRERVTTYAAGLRRPEGMDRGPDGSLYIAEHWPNGNVYRFAPDGTRSVLGQADDGEGLRVLPDGSVVVAETTSNLVSRFLPDGNKVTVVEGTLTSPDGIAYDPSSDRLLITEDEAPGRLLRVNYESGELEVIATGLHQPQTMLLEADGSILVSEQGENRILRLRPVAP